MKEPFLSDRRQPKAILDFSMSQQVSEGGIKNEEAPLWAAP